MTATINENRSVAVEFNPLRYKKKTLSLILAKAEQWNCRPSEAESRLLDELAQRKSKSAA